MLVLSRNAGQSVKIGEDIKVIILDTKGSQVKVGIVAPDDMVIVREEIISKKKKTGS